MKLARTFGLAAVMVFALTALLATSSASAKTSTFHNPESASATAVRGSLSGANHVLTLGGLAEQFKCSKVSFSGQIPIGNPEPESITVAPELGGCSWQLGQVWTWNMNGCKFLLRPGPGNPETATTYGWIDIVGCQSAMSIGTGQCLLTIGNQNGIGTVQYKGISGGTVQMIANTGGIKYTRSSGCYGPKGTFSDGTYTGEWNVKGSSVVNESIQKALGLNPAPPTNFNVEETPAAISGSAAEDKAIFMVGSNGAVKCSTHSLSGASAAATPKSITVAGTYSECSFLGQSATLSMGGCSYVLHASGGFDIVGANCASNPITVSTNTCTGTIGPQSGSSGLTYANAGWGKFRSVITGGEAKGLKGSATGPGCMFSGAFSNGVYRSIDLFTATNSLGQAQGLWME